MSPDRSHSSPHGHYTVFTPGFRVVAHSNEPPYAYVPLSAPLSPDGPLPASPGRIVRSHGGTALNDPHRLSAGNIRTHDANMLSPSNTHAYMHPSSPRSAPNASPYVAPHASLYPASPTDRSHPLHVPVPGIDESPSIGTEISHGDTTIAEDKPNSRKRRSGTIRRRAKNAFIFFRSYISAPLCRDRLGLPEGAGQQLVSQRAAAIWRGLPNSEKAPFFAQAEADKVRLQAGLDDTLDAQDDEAAETGEGERNKRTKRKHRKTRPKASTQQQDEPRNAGFWLAQQSVPPTPTSTLTLSPLPTVSPAVSDRSLGESSCASGASPLSVPKTPLHPFPLITIPEVQSAAMWERTPIEPLSASPAALVPHYTSTANAGIGEGNASPEFDFNSMAGSQQSEPDWSAAPPSAYAREGVPFDSYAMYAGANTGANVEASFGAASSGLNIFFDHNLDLNKERGVGGNSYSPAFPGAGGPGNMMMGGGTGDFNSLGLGLGLGVGRNTSGAMVTPRLNMAFNNTNMNANFNGNINAMDIDNNTIRTPVTPRIVVDAHDDDVQRQAHSSYNWDNFFNAGRSGF